MTLIQYLAASPGGTVIKGLLMIWKTLVPEIFPLGTGFNHFGDDIPLGKEAVCVILISPVNDQAGNFQLPHLS